MHSVQTTASMQRDNSWYIIDLTFISLLYLIPFFFFFLVLFTSSFMLSLRVLFLCVFFVCIYLYITISFMATAFTPSSSSLSSSSPWWYQCSLNVHVRYMYVLCSRNSVELTTFLCCCCLLFYLYLLCALPIPTSTNVIIYWITDIIASIWKF